MAKMSIQEAFDTALIMDGKDASAGMSINTHPDQTIGVYVACHVSVCGVYGHGDNFEECFKQIEIQ
mgnify:CR=1 FL=1